MSDEHDDEERCRCAWFHCEVCGNHLPDSKGGSAFLKGRWYCYEHAPADAITRHEAAARGISLKELMRGKHGRHVDANTREDPGIIGNGGGAKDDMSEYMLTDGQGDEYSYQASDMRMAITVHEQIVGTTVVRARLI